jgi:hypothetical protein
MDKAQVGLGMILVVHQHTTKVLSPGKQPFHFPAACIPPEGAAVLGVGVFPLRSMRGQQLNPLSGQALIARIAVIGLVPDPTFRLAIDHTRGESWFNKDDFRRRSRR